MAGFHCPEGLLPHAARWASALVRLVEIVQIVK
jgi:hypothetical protein